MAKSTTGRAKFKMQRALGLELPGLGKPGALGRRPYGPGVHGNRRKKISDYAIRLKEKQKILYHYGLREKQLVKYVRTAKCDRSGRPWMDVMLCTLESRLSNVIFRLNWAPSIPAAAQIISHGQVLINGKKNDRSSYLLQQGDVISLTPKGYKNQVFKFAQESPRMHAAPANYNVEIKGEEKVATMAQPPLSEDVPFDFESQLVIEYYWKVK